MHRELRKKRRIQHNKLPAVMRKWCLAYGIGLQPEDKLANLIEKSHWAAALELADADQLPWDDTFT